MLNFTRSADLRVQLDKFYYAYRISVYNWANGNYAYNVTNIQVTLSCKYDLNERFHKINGSVVMGEYNNGGFLVKR